MVHFQIKGYCPLFYVITYHSSSIIWKQVIQIKEEVKEIGGFKFSSKDGRLVVFACDFFKITSEQLGNVDAVYDR